MKLEKIIFWIILEQAFQNKIFTLKSSFMHAVVTSWKKKKEKLQASVSHKSWKKKTDFAPLWCLLARKPPIFKLDFNPDITQNVKKSQITKSFYKIDVEYLIGL